MNTKKRTEEKFYMYNEGQIERKKEEWTEGQVGLGRSAVVVVVVVVVVA